MAKISFSRLQSVREESAPPAVTMVNVMTVTWVMVPVPVTQVLRAWPVKSVVMDSMEPPVKVSSGAWYLLWRPQVLVMLTNCFLQPVTVQNTGHVTADGEVQGHASAMLAGPENAARPSSVRSLAVFHSSQTGHMRNWYQV